MIPYIYIMRDEGRVGPFGEGSRPPGWMEPVGWVISHNSQMELYQPMEERSKWCVSVWETIPPDTLWLGGIGVKSSVYTIARFSNLDFRGTPFEHRYLEHTCRYNRELAQLALNEYCLWGPTCEAYVPFKNPQPSGYKGVYGNFGVRFTHDKPIVDVYDMFLSGNHVLRVY